MAADGGGKTGLSKSQKALARRLAERIGDSMLPGETALSAARLFDAADFLLEAALVRSDGNLRSCFAALRAGEPCAWR